MRLHPLLVVLVALAGCGGGGARADTAPPPPRELPPPEIRGSSPLIPRVAVGPPPPGSAQVIRSWAAAVRRADWGRAADLVASGARVQTGPEVERLPTRNQVLSWNASLPCGARVERIGGAKGYAIVRLRLTERAQGDCGDGVGNVIRAAIRVREGRIVALYVLT